ncbi:hypothetical protein [Methanosarcina sp. DH2]|nr:hypothetical protein [Methanosarcina sp. DH2]
MSVCSGKTRASCLEGASSYKSRIVLRKNPENNLRGARRSSGPGFV